MKWELKRKPLSKRKQKQPEIREVSPGDGYVVWLVLVMALCNQPEACDDLGDDQSRYLLLHAI